MKHDIFSYNIAEIPQLLTELNQPRFRAQQLLSWLYVKGARSYDEMTNLPASLRNELSETYPCVAPKIVDKQTSSDRTRKYVLEFSDGTRVETVGIPSADQKKNSDPRHLTVCFSTQAGCAMECAFCATGTEGLSRNLSSGEMVAQITAVAQDFGCRVTNVVSMGQGEPFQNYDSCLDALRFINSDKGLGIGARHITISTCGILSGIANLSSEPEQFTLAVSLHSAIQETRDKLMPRCKSLKLDALNTSLRDYSAKTGRRVSLEYLMIEDVNDTPESLDALIRFCEGLFCHVNLIPINAVDYSPFHPSPSATQKKWVRSLRENGVETTIRNSRGSDIDGACGQLKNKVKH